MRKTIALPLLLGIILFNLLAPVTAKASIPQWGILWIVLPRLNVTHNGTRFTSSLTSEEVKKIKEMSERTECFIEESSGNAVDIQMTVIESTRTVTSLTEDSSK